MALRCQEIDNILLDYVRGMVESQIALAVETHARHCETCRNSISELQEMTDLLMTVRDEPLTTPRHHVRTILTIAHELAPSPPTGKKSISTFAWIAGIFKRQFYIPALSMAMCAMIVISVFYFNHETVELTVAFRATEDIGFPRQIRGGVADSEKTADPIVWFFSDAPASILKKIYHERTLESVVDLISVLYSEENAHVAGANAKSAKDVIAHIHFRIETGKLTSDSISVFFEERLADQLEKLEPQSSITLCAGVSDTKNGLQIKLGRYDRWLHGDIGHVQQ